MHHVGLDKTPITTIREKALYPVGEHKVISADVLMRFLDTKETIEEHLAGLIKDILKEALELFSRIPAKEGLTLNIPMGHRYTRFIYVVDPQTIYIPYHYHDPTIYGIYLREKNTYDDAEAFLRLAWNLLQDDRFLDRLKIPEVDRSYIKIFMKHPVLGLSTLIVLYIEALYLHALAHHVVEDVSTLFEFNNLGEYSIIKDSKEEEAFCEFVMYNSMHGALEPNIAYKLLCKMRDIMIIPPIALDDAMRFLRSHRRAFVAALYIHKNKTVYKDYPFLKPAVSEEIAKKISPLFRSLWYAHVLDHEPLEIDESVSKRVFTMNL
ncbi:MAG: hypothetical protein NDP22_05190 [Crenarchaeota archaeon]|nr:hypothetical protein [Thermoproteota archaeon]